jgi:hypothetical protein
MARRRSGCPNGASARAQLAKGQFEGVALNLGLPRIDGSSRSGRAMS